MCIIMHYIWCKFSIIVFKEWCQNGAFLKMLIGTNLVSNICTKASKKAQYLMLIYQFLVQIRCRFSAHFSVGSSPSVSPLFVDWPIEIEGYVFRWISGTPVNEYLSLYPFLLNYSKLNIDFLTCWDYIFKSVKSNSKL